MCQTYLHWIIIHVLTHLYYVAMHVLLHIKEEIDNENTQIGKDKSSGEWNRLRWGMAGTSSGRREHWADPLCFIKRNQHSGLLDGRPEIQRYHWKRNQRKPQSVVHSGTYWFYMERQPVFPYQRYEIRPSCIRRSVKKTADRLHWSRHDPLYRFRRRMGTNSAFRLHGLCDGIKKYRCDPPHRYEFP